ncbi:MAG: alpha/beta hydrolase [Candidatus Omnitrophica bacterium]|nr:alpha/beta hydrolase [Candidatus Omnitrophota bacterium]
MRFKEGDYLNYSLVDLTDEKGKSIRDEGKFFAYSQQAINERCPHNIFFVHGYNNDFFAALETTYQYFDILSAFRNFRANYVGAFWPGDTGAHFSRAVRQADKASANFANLISYIIKNSKVSKPYITIIAHSLGNRISAKAILELRSRHRIAPVRNFLQLAPAINANAYQKEFKDIPGLVKNIVVYHSARDRILNFYYAMWNIRRLKSGPKNKGLGVYGPYGPVPQNVHSLKAKDIARVNVKHGTYLENKRLIQSVAKNIK